jgi:hypothetical protein
MKRILVFAAGWLACVVSGSQVNAQAAVLSDSAAARVLFAPVHLQPQQAIEHSDAYYTRLTIHRVGSYAMLPLFAGEYLLGEKLIDGDAANWVKSTHVVVAGAIGALFGVNTVTGVWNLIESRKDPGGTRRLIHSALMLAADAGFAYTGTLPDDDGESEGNNRHRDFAVGSMAVSAAGTALMWLWKN